VEGGKSIRNNKTKKIAERHYEKKDYFSRQNDKGPEKTAGGNTTAGLLNRGKEAPGILKEPNKGGDLFTC